LSLSLSLALIELPRWIHAKDVMYLGYTAPAVVTVQFGGEKPEKAELVSSTQNAEAI
jgi:hypothetical protein